MKLLLLNLIAFFLVILWSPTITAQQSLNNTDLNEMTSVIGNPIIQTFTNSNLNDRSSGNNVDKVLLLWAEGVNPFDADASAADIIVKLFNAGIPQVDFFNFTVQNNYPVLDLYWQYDAVLVAAEGNGNPAIFGDTLAIYTDGGGGVVDMLELAGGFFELQGRFNDDYMIWDAPNDGSAFEFNEMRTLGTVNDPTHPIMQGVNTFSGGTWSVHFNGDPENGGQILAEYDNGESFVVINENMGPSSAKRAFLNFHPVSGDLNPGYWDSGTDGALLMKNALDWVANENRFDGCGELNLSVSNGYNIDYNASSASAIKAATDLTVKRNSDFELTTITANVASNGPISAIDVTYYTDNGGLPGSNLDSDVGIVPVSQEVIGSEGGFDVYKVVLDVPAFTFSGQIGSETTYWIELSVTNDSSSADVFWVATSSSQAGGSMALDTGSGWTIPSNNLDAVYLFEGNCIDLYDSGCNTNVPTNYLFETGLNCSSTTNRKTANDILLNQNEDLELTQIKTNLFVTGDVDVVDVFYYDDNNGLPGTVIGSQLNITPTFQSVIGISQSQEIREVILDVDPFLFEGSGSGPSTYWVELSVTNASQSDFIFWVGTRENGVGNPMAHFVNGGWVYFLPNHDGVYSFAGNCFLNTEEFTAADFRIAPMPANDLLNVESSQNISTVSIYNMLGQEVLTQLTNSQQFSLDISMLTSGSYILRAETSEGTIVSKSILVR